jgi:hypothetical protein
MPDIVGQLVGFQKSAEVNFQKLFLKKVRIRAKMAVFGSLYSWNKVRGKNQK